MRSFVYVIRDRAGIHARPAGIVVKEAKKHSSEITVSLGEKQADAKSLTGLMSMGIRFGDEIRVEVSGGGRGGCVRGHGSRIARASVKREEVMGNIWHDISEERIFPTDFISVIEISKGSKKKYELDKETGYIILDRVLYTSTHYPMKLRLYPANARGRRRSA